MNKTNFVLKALLLLLVFSSCNPEREPEDFTRPDLQIDVGLQEGEIRNLILMESRYFTEGKVEKWIGCYTNHEKTSFIYSAPEVGEGILKAEGNRELRGLVGKLFQRPIGVVEILEREDWNITIEPTMGLITFRQITSIDGREFISEEIRVVEKKGDSWKLALRASIF